MSVGWVSEARLARITQTDDPVQQAAVLRRMGIEPIIGVLGGVSVTQEALHAAQLGRRQRQDTGLEFDWEALNAAPSKRSA